MLNKEQIIDILSKEESLLVPDEILEAIAEEYLSINGQTLFTFEQYLRIRYIEVLVKLKRRRYLQNPF